MTEYVSESQQETERLGAEFANALKGGDVIAMFAELGAGKTAFVRGVLRGLGYDGYVSSPTFAFVNEYDTGDFILSHFDMYRIENEEQLYSIGYYDYLDDRHVLMLEWAENVEFALDDDTVRIHIYGSGDEPRRITIENG